MPAFGWSVCERRSSSTDRFKVTASRHGPFDLVLLEVGAFHESWGDIHLGPKNALEAFKMSGGGTLLPVHWGTFNLGRAGRNLARARTGAETASVHAEDWAGL